MSNWRGLAAMGKTKSHRYPNWEKHEQEGLEASRYKPQLRRNRSVFTLLFQTLAIAAIPFGEGGPLLDAIYGGGPLSVFVGWIVVCLLCECIALSLAELASRYPTSAGPYYWSYRVAGRSKAAVSFVTCWVWLIGNWTITLSVNFGFGIDSLGIDLNVPSRMDNY